MLAEHEESKSNPALSKLLRKQWPRENQTHFVPLDPCGERTTLEVGGRGALMGPVQLVEGSLSVHQKEKSHPGLETGGVELGTCHFRDTGSNVQGNLGRA